MQVKKFIYISQFFYYCCWRLQRNKLNLWYFQTNILIFPCFCTYPYKKRVDFVKMKRSKWEPTKHSAVCSHFKAEDYVYQCSAIPEYGKPSVPSLKRDSIKVILFPTIHAADVNKSLSQSDRTRKVWIFILALFVKLKWLKHLWL